MNRTLNIFFTMILFICGLHEVSSQDIRIEDDEANEILDNILMDDADDEVSLETISNFQFIYFSLNYNNDTYFSGRDIDIDQFNIRPQLTYLHSNGFFASVGGVYYSEFDPKIDYISSSLGYAKAFGKKKRFRWNSSYSRYFYSNATNNPYTNILSFGIGIRNKNKKLGSSIQASYLFGGDNSFQVTSSSFAILSLYKSKKTKLNLRPQLSIIAGQQTIELAQTSFQNGTITINYLESDVFDLINTQLSIPLQIQTSSIDVEIGYTINFPSPLKYEEALSNTGFFNIYLGYMFDL